MSATHQVQIIITAPHSYCLPSSILPFRHCDRSAHRMAVEIVRALRQEQKIPKQNIKLLLSNVLRSQMDLNRIESKNSDFQQALTPYLQEASVLMDVHSFPLNSDFGLINDVYVLISPDVNPQVQAQSRRLIQELQQAGYRANVHWGAKTVNYIVERANQHENLKSAVLLEVNENLSRGVLHDMASIVANWVVTNTN
jgi:hypothetical protein